MNIRDPILFQQLPMIQKIIQDETWLAGERRGCQVHSDDREVRDRVCEVILRVGQQLRDALSAAGESGVSQHATGEHRLDRRCDDPDGRAGEAGGVPIDYVI
jgi:hypothetical protein